VLVRTSWELKKRQMKREENEWKEKRPRKETEKETIGKRPADFL